MDAEPLPPEPMGVEMSYTANVVKVMIASPGDVTDERDATREVIHEWNVVHSEERKTVLLPVGWDTHSSPMMGDRPQAIINKQILAGCDLLVAVFWTRIGSPTGAAVSGTIEEIQEHLATGKPAMIYFSSAPVRPDSVDNKQYSALQKFKTDCKSRGLIEGYESVTEFRGKFARQLAQRIASDFAGYSEDATSLLATFLNRSEEPELSDRAAKLLKGAAADHDWGKFFTPEFESGLVIQLKNDALVNGCEGREKAAWKSAIAELERNELIEAKGYKREMFEVTEKGFRYAERLT